MINTLLDILYGRRQYVWRSKDYDIPVNFIKVAGSKDGVEYAQVEFEGYTSFVPVNEIVVIRSRS